MVMAQKLAQEKNYSITETTQRISFSLFEKIVSKINVAHRVQIVGIGGSGLTAKDLGYKLQKLELPPWLRRITMCKLQRL